MSEEKKEPEVKDKKAIERDHRIRRNLCCCGLIFGVLLIFIAISFVPFISSMFSSRADAPIPSFSNSIVTRTSTPESQTQTANFPEPQDCAQVDVPDAVGVPISTSNPGLKEDSNNVIYYSIYGYTYNQLMSQINKCGIKADDGNFAGNTNWRINWQYNYYEDPKGCQITDAVVGVKVDIYYPKWQKPQDYASGLADIWQNYMSSLENHENEHKKIVMAGAGEIYNKLSNFSSTSSCDVASRDATDAANQIIEQIKADNVAFDTRTNHGANPEN